MMKLPNLIYRIEANGKYTEVDSAFEVGHIVLDLVTGLRENGTRLPPVAPEDIRLTVRLGPDPDDGPVWKAIE